MTKSYEIDPHTKAIELLLMTSFVTESRVEAKQTAMQVIDHIIDELLQYEWQSPELVDYYANVKRELYIIE